jgi:hypothetical protein
MLGQDVLHVSQLQRLITVDEQNVPGVRSASELCVLCPDNLSKARNQVVVPILGLVPRSDSRLGGGVPINELGNLYAN